eukprot:scaffold32931_cov62-Phaeocystis_antarctica.AAC.1
MVRPVLGGESLVRMGMCVRSSGQCPCTSCGARAGGRELCACEVGVDWWVERGAGRPAASTCAIVRLPWWRVAPGSKWVWAEARASVG